MMRETEHRNGHQWSRSSVVDQEAVDHERIFGLVQASGEIIRVRVAQRVDYDLLSEPVQSRAYPLRINVGDVELSPDQAGNLLEALGQATKFAEDVERRNRPRLVAEV